MKKGSAGWKTLAALALAASAWRRLSEDLPIDGVIIPPADEPPRPDPPTCPRFTYSKWDDEAKVWRCVPKGLL